MEERSARVGKKDETRVDTSAHKPGRMLKKVLLKFKTRYSYQNVCVYVCVD